MDTCRKVWEWLKSKCWWLQKNKKLCSCDDCPYEKKD